MLSKHEDGMVIARYGYADTLNLKNPKMFVLQDTSKAQTKPALQTKDYLKMISYQEENNKMESSDNYLKRMQPYMKLYGALIQFSVYSQQRTCLESLAMTSDLSLYWKIKYVSRLQYLWDDIKKDQIEIPEFVQRHDQVLEERPLTAYGIEQDPLRLIKVHVMDYSFVRYEEKWATGTREYM